jgi:hypothetical protein
MRRRAGPAVDDVQHAAAGGRRAGGPAVPRAAVLVYHDTAVGPLPRGPAADAALAAAALTSPGEVGTHGATARGGVIGSVVPTLFAAALAAAIAILAWRRSTS